MNRKRVISHCCLAGVICWLASGCASTPVSTTPQPPTPQTSAQVGDQTIVAIMPQPAAGPTLPSLPEFLGIPQLFKGTFGAFRFLRDRITARLGGMFPGLEPRPPLKLLADPANLSEDAPPSVQAAAKIKQEQDAGAQKAKAAAYLATVGCGCYEGVAEALAENLNDCNEEVRHATVKALREIGSKATCACGGNSCCTEEVHKGLMRLAWEVDDSGCFVEPSQRVRRLARLALENCCMPTASEPTQPEEGPELEEGELLSRRADSRLETALGGSDPTVALRAATVGRVEPTAGNTESPAGSVLATVNGEPIRYEDLPYSDRQRLTESQSVGWGQLSEAERMEILAATIDRKILAQAARDVLSASVQREVQQQIARTAAIAPQSPSVVPVSFAEGDSAVELEHGYARELLRRQVDHDPYLSSREIELHYSSNPQRYRDPDQYRWQHHRIDHSRLTDPSQAVELLRFARLRATGFRTQPPAGLIESAIEIDHHDWKTLGEIESPSLRSTLEKLSPGQASEIRSTSTETSFVIVTEVRLGDQKPLRDVTSRIKTDLLRERRRAAEAAYVSQLRGRATIQVMPDGGLH